MVANVHGFQPLDMNDPKDRACEKYREKMLGLLEQAIRENRDELASAIAGSLIALAEALLAAGTSEKKLADALAYLGDFAVAQATEGRVLTPGFLASHGQLGGKQ